MKMCDKLMALRKENGWSQEDFAEKLDVSRQAISRWENGTALPDSQNLLRISKLFGVTADYLLNDDYENRTNSFATERILVEPASSSGKKRWPLWTAIAVVCVAILFACVAITAVRRSNTGHVHPALIRMIENETAATCTDQGGYDEVIYCAECGEEVLRTHITTGMPAHRFENEKCVICGEEQRAR